MDRGIGEWSEVKHSQAQCRKQNKRMRVSESDPRPGLHLTLKIEVLVLSKIAASSQRVNILVLKALCSLFCLFVFVCYFHFSRGLYFKLPLLYVSIRRRIQKWFVFRKERKYGF